MHPIFGGNNAMRRTSHPAYFPGQIELGGLLTGAEVLTLDGALPVEHLTIGDRVITRTAGATRLLDLCVDTVTEHAVEITGGALGKMDPDITLILPASQVVLLRDWRAKVMFGQPQAAVPVGVLVDHGFIRDLGETEMRLHRLIFDRDHVIYASGLELCCTPRNTDLRTSLRTAA